mmetsp:Transcript_24178/g.60231  ORF Transcript_24178/g.60231 Transcript_24178/m.60231 type:complete len:98 (+) Transcript_24178:168-461(+)
MPAGTAIFVLETFEMESHPRLRGSYKRLRLSKRMPHEAIKVGEKVIYSGRAAGKTKPEQKVCVTCGGDAIYRCGTCHAALHLGVSQPQKAGAAGPQC